MAIARGAVLKFSLEISNNGSELTITPHNAQPLPPIAGNLSLTGLGTLRESLGKDLDDFKDKVGSALEVSNWQSLSQSLRKLHEKGRALAFQLFGMELRKITELLRQHCPHRVTDPAQLASPDFFGWSETDALPRVEVNALLENFIPMEFLPLFNMTEPEEVKNLSDLYKVASSFLGFSVVVKRADTRLGAAKLQNLMLENVPKLPIKFFRYDGLAGVRKEMEFFQHWEEHIDLEGPWPDVHHPAQEFEKLFADHIWHFRRRFDGNDRESADQIHHFSCHCDTKSDDSANYHVELGHDPQTRRKVTIGKLNARFGELAAGGDRCPDSPPPFVFFNACGSSKIKPGEMASFPRLFFTIGSRGFIGTETRIPDQVAAEFSKYFYTKLLSGYPLGDAVQAAKRMLLTRYNNPLGVLYTVYADPDLVVSQPVLR